MVRQPDATRQPTPQDNQLLSKHHVLSFKPQLRLEWRGHDGESETEQPDHSPSLGDSVTSSTRIRFSVRTGRLRRKGGRFAPWPLRSTRSQRRPRQIRPDGRPSCACRNPQKSCARSRHRRSNTETRLTPGPIPHLSAVRPAGWIRACRARRRQKLPTR